MTDTELLSDSAHELGIELDDAQVKKFLYYLDELKLWNKKLNLTSLVNNREIIIKHFIDSLTTYNYLFKDCYILDIGSGAGFPGIPLAIADVSFNLTLLESREKRIHFLNHIVRKLELPNVRVKRGRTEDRENGIERDYFDFVICRAFGKIEQIIEVGKEYLNKKGKIILMRGARGEHELEIFRHGQIYPGIIINDEHQIVLPNSNYKRLNVLLSFK